MNLRQFKAANMREVMVKIRAVMGEDAVIISSKQTSQGVEVTAAVDREVDSSQGLKPVQDTVDNREDRTDPLWQIRQEMEEMKQLLHQQVASLAWKEEAHQNPAKVKLIQRLMGMGVAYGLAKQWSSRLDDLGDESQLWVQCQRQILLDWPLSNQDILDKGGIMALMGPTGVGKTTTIAKIAAKYAMRNGVNGIALITTDNFKLGATAQINQFADLLKVPLYKVESANQLFDTIASLGHKSLVLIDTAGMSQRDQRLNDELVNYVGSGQVIANYLVCSAATQYNVLKDVYKGFSQVPLSGVIFTKVDEALQLGPALSLLVETRLPLTFLTNGQQVPEDILFANGREFLDWVIRLSQQYADMSAGMELGLQQEMMHGL